MREGRIKKIGKLLTTLFLEQRLGGSSCDKAKALRPELALGGLANLPRRGKPGNEGNLENLRRGKPGKFTPRATWQIYPVEGNLANSRRGKPGKFT